MENNGNGDIYKSSHIIAKIIESISEMNPGTIITWDTIKGWAQTDSKQKATRFIHAARKGLIAAHGLWIQSERKVGYRVVPPGGEIEMVKGKFEDGRKRCRTAISESRHIRLNVLPESAKAVTVAEINHMRTLAGLLALGGNPQ